MLEQPTMRTSNPTLEFKTICCLLLHWCCNCILVILLDCMKDAIAQQHWYKPKRQKMLRQQHMAWNWCYLLTFQVSQTVFRHWQFASLQYTNGEEKGEREREREREQGPWQSISLYLLHNFIKYMIFLQFPTLSKQVVLITITLFQLPLLISSTIIFYHDQQNFWAGW
jgi:hypothetical protein